MREALFFENRTLLLGFDCRPCYQVVIKEKVTRLSGYSIRIALDSSLADTKNPTTTYLLSVPDIFPHNLSIISIILPNNISAQSVELAAVYSG